MTSRIRLQRRWLSLTAALLAAALLAALLLVTIAQPAHAVDDPTPTPSPTDTVAPDDTSTPTPTSSALPYCDPEPTATADTDTATDTPTPTETPDAEATPTPEATCIPVGEAGESTSYPAREVPDWPWITLLVLTGIGLAAWIATTVARRRRHSAALRRLAERP